jgi:thiol:disulfide interchange protein
VLQLAMSALVALAGLFLVITAENDYRLFGWFLLLLGVLGMASPFVMRALRRR